MAADESFQQEYIPVGCVPSAAVAVSAPGGCLLLRVVSGPGWGGVLLLGGCLLPGGVCSRGASARGRGVVSQHAPRQILPVNRMTDRCKKHNLRKLRLRTVKSIESTLTLHNFIFLADNGRYGQDSGQRFNTDYLLTCAK